MAEFTGVMLGDGYLSNDRLKISLNSEVDRDYTEYVSGLIISLFGEDPIIKERKNENCLDLFVFRRSVLRNLFLWGLKKSPKRNNAVIPCQFLEYGSDVLRGLFDTDGCLVVANNNGYSYPRLEIKISPCPMQKQVINVLERLDFKFGVYDIGDGKVRIQLNGLVQLEMWINLIGFSNLKHIRKARQFFGKNSEGWI